MIGVWLQVHYHWWIIAACWWWDVRSGTDDSCWCSGGAASGAKLNDELVADVLQPRRWVTETNGWSINRLVRLDQRWTAYKNYGFWFGDSTGPEQFPAIFFTQFFHPHPSSHLVASWHVLSLFTRGAYLIQINVQLFIHVSTFHSCFHHFIFFPI